MFGSTNVDINASASNAPVMLENKKIANQKQAIIGMLYQNLFPRNSGPESSILINQEVKNVFKVLNRDDSLILFVAALKSQKKPRITKMWELIKDKYPFPVNLQEMISTNKFTETHPFWQLDEKIIVKIALMLMIGEVNAVCCEWLEKVVAPFFKISAYDSMIDESAFLIQTDKFLSEYSQKMLSTMLNRAAKREHRMVSVNKFFKANKVCQWIEKHVTPMVIQGKKSYVPSTYHFNSLDDEYYDWINNAVKRTPPNNLLNFLVNLDKDLAASLANQLEVNTAINLTQSEGMLRMDFNFNPPNLRPAPILGNVVSSGALYVTHDLTPFTLDDPSASTKNKHTVQRGVPIIVFDMPTKNLPLPNASNTTPDLRKFIPNLQKLAMPPINPVNNGLSASPDLRKFIPNLQNLYVSSMSQPVVVPQQPLPDVRLDDSSDVESSEPPKKRIKKTEFLLNSIFSRETNKDSQSPTPGSSAFKKVGSSKY